MNRATTAILVLLLAGCATRTADAPCGVDCPATVFTTETQRDVDILFVIDNTEPEEQQALVNGFPTLLEALHSPRLGSAIPSLHIGVVSTDLGAGNHGLPSCEVAGGDNAKLQALPRLAGCTPPTQPFISYEAGVTNINSPTIDPIQQMDEAFSCIAMLGSAGCHFKHTIESARRALDPAVNPGFLRGSAVLAVLFLTVQDDCSARKPELFDPSQTSMNDPLGPLTSFRCFEFGIQCDINDRSKPGPRKGCKPAYDWLYRIESYVGFFKGLRPEGQVVMAAIAGPVDKVEVGMDAQNPVLRPSCQTSMGRARPAIRIKALLDSFGNKGLFNGGTDKTLTQDLPVDVCRQSYAPALRRLGRAIVSTLVGRCLPKPLLTLGGGLACHKGDVIGAGATCRQSCLDQADCHVQIQTPSKPPQSPAVDVPRCAPAKFANPADTDCGDTCPCWRIVPNPAECSPIVGTTPYRFEVLPWPSPSPGSTVAAHCRQSEHPWGSAELAALPQCE